MQSTRISWNNLSRLKLLLVLSPLPPSNSRVGRVLKVFTFGDCRIRVYLSSNQPTVISEGLITTRILGPDPTTSEVYRVHPIVDPTKFWQGDSHGVICEHLSHFTTTENRHHQRRFRYLKYMQMRWWPGLCPEPCCMGELTAFRRPKAGFRGGWGKGEGRGKERCREKGAGGTGRGGKGGEGGKRRNRSGPNQVWEKIDAPKWDDKRIDLSQDMI